MTISTDNPGESVALTDTDPGAPSPGGGFSLKVGDFEGPFDLLLSLIARHKLEVTELALHEVTDEFIAYIKAKGSDWDLDEASSFLVVAATLLDLKAARLLPSGEVEDEEDLALLEARDLLFARLLQYRAYKQVAGLLADQMDNASKRIARSVTLEPQFAALLPEVLIGLGAEQFAAMAALAMAPKEAEHVGLGHLHVPKVSVREQAAVIVYRLRRSRTSTFRALVADADSLLVVVGRFLALLELYREHVVLFDQVAPLGDLTIRWVGSEDGDVDVTDEFDVERDVDQQQQEVSRTQDGPERNDR
ncbi:MAG: segregation/condensation protein A [Actinomycetales bacterium]|nr:segregation/condensation protein A [Actinomycetales bacterium]MCP4892804.1 segregation/condensation protein A [Actinomycetales bacterium]